MKLFLKIIFIALIALLCSSVLAAENPDTNYNMSFGVAGMFMINDAYVRSGDVQWNGSSGFGVGIIFEKMFTNLLGIQSGAWFTQGDIKIKIPNGSSPGTTDGIVQSRSISIPLYLIISLNTSVFSVNFQAGFNSAQFIQSKLILDDPYNKTSNVLYDIGYFQFAVSGGIQFKFRNLAAYIDFITGVHIDFYVTNLLKDQSNSVTNLYNFRFTGGILFRTNLFPIPEK